MPVYVDALELENKTVPILRVQYEEEVGISRPGIYLTIGRVDVILRNIDVLRDFVNDYGKKENGWKESEK